MHVMGYSGCLRHVRFLGWMYPSVKVHAPGKSTMRCTMFHEDYIFDLHDDDVGPTSRIDLHTMIIPPGGGGFKNMFFIFTPKIGEDDEPNLTVA